MKSTTSHYSLMGFIFAVAMLTTFLFFSRAYAQAPDFTWIKQAGGTSLDRGYGVATDGSGNSFITGYFYAYTATFDTITLTSAGSYDIFIAKYDTSGNALWAQQAGGPYWDNGYSVATDDAGNSIITGRFEDTAFFGTITLTSADKGDIFIAKYDASGNVIWAKRAGGTNHDEGHGIAVDGGGNIIITGFFEGTANFGMDTLTTEGGRDIFIAKYDAEGNVLWARRAGGSNWDSGLGIAVDKSDHIIITGNFRSTANFGSITLTSSGQYDIFIAKYDAMGNVLWAKQAGGEDDDYGNSISVDGSGNSLVTGYFNDIASFGTIMLTSGGGSDIFISKYDASGNVLWSKRAGGTGDDEGYGITADRYGNIPIIGYFRETATFDTIALNSAGNKDIFMANYDPSGNVVWAIGAGGTGYDEGYGIATNGLGNSVVTGYFDNTAIFGSKTLISAGGPDIFIANLGKAWKINGQVGYYSNDGPVDNALLKLNNIDIDTTDLNGNYEILSLPIGSYVIRPEKENDIGNAINAYDAAWILQHGVGLRTFTPFQKIAGDVSGNGSVTAYDAAKILQFGVGLIKQFPVMSDSTHFWRFVPEDFPINDTNWVEAPDSIAYTPLDSDTTGNYMGIIYGDVSGNWHPSAAASMASNKSSSETVDIRLENIYGEKGAKVILPVSVENASGIVSMSFSLEYDAQIIRALSASTTELTADWQIAYCVKEGVIKVALAGIKLITDSGSIVNLAFQVLAPELSDATSALNISEISINEGNIAARVQRSTFTSGSPVPKEYALSQNYPNPFNARTMIKYQIPSAGKVVLKIYNLAGQVVRTLVDEEKQPGYYQVNWDGKNDRGIKVTSGIYLYQIRVGDFKQERKLLLIL